MNSRKVAAEVLCTVLGQGRSLTAALDHARPAVPSSRDRALVQSLCYGTLRWYFRLDAILAQLLKRPVKQKDLDIRVLALLGLYQIAHTRVKAHAAVAETVAAASHKPWAKSLLNAILRSYQRERESLDRIADLDPSGRSAHPVWLLDGLRRYWPQHLDEICEANNTLPPMVLRVNRKKCDRDAYLKMLNSAEMDASTLEFTPDALLLAKPVDVERLPGFSEGLVSVQDAAAQFAAYLLDSQSGERILDACAAPGGKTAHILERVPSLQEVWALDIDAERAARISANLKRLGLEATVRTGDLLDPSVWWDGRPFERILLDAPCSATGVIRRHPDIKVLRRPSDIDVLAETQQKLLESAWRMLAPGGVLVYSTCSVLSQENHEQIARFMKSHPEAEEIPIEARWGIACPFGRQILPGQSGMDGFYYARLSRKE